METLSTQLDDALLWVRLDLPEELNAFSEAMGDELLRVFETASLHDAVARKRAGTDG